MIGQLFVWIALAGATAVDTWSLYHGVKRNQRGRGPSGIPLLPWAIYVTCAAFLPCTITVKVVAIALLSLFHVSCLWLIPLLYREYYNGKTQLHRAVRRGDSSSVERLIRQGAEVDAKGNEGSTPLHVAIERGHVAAAESLLSSGGDPNTRDRNGMTPLHLAVWRVDRGTVELLIRSGADPNIKSEFGTSPGDIAEDTGDRAIIAMMSELPDGPDQ